MKLGVAMRFPQAMGHLRVLRERYLALIEATLAGVIYEDNPQSGALFDPTVREYGWDWPSKAFTMIGTKRLRNFRNLVESVIGENVPGDIVEAGVWRGGACIMARAVLATYGVENRKVILADSFEGLPPPDPIAFPADADSKFHEFKELSVSIEQVKHNFTKFDLLDEQVVFLKGWFKETLPSAPISEIAVLRLDADMYESTMTALRYLYDKVSAGGWVIIDDYLLVPACRTAVDEFLAQRQLFPNLQPIDGVGVYFRVAS